MFRCQDCCEVAADLAWSGMFRRIDGHGEKVDEWQSINEDGLNKWVSGSL
jgi:hypothetical protein